MISLHVLELSKNQHTKQAQLFGHQMINFWAKTEKRLIST